LIITSTDPKKEEMDEKRILALLANSCSRTFKLLYDKYHHKVFKVAFNLGLDQNDALELVQDVFVTIWERRELFVNVNSLEAYIIAITKNITYKKMRKKAFEHANKVYFSDELNLLHIMPELEIETEEINSVTAKALEQLSPQQKTIFALYTQENLTQQQIADSLNISVRTVENLIYRAKKKLKEYLKISLLAFISLLI
jgi:RNA polymerase sigma-70 factor (family 1)